MPEWLRGKDSEAAWERAKKIVSDEYGKGLKDSDPNKFYALVTTIYKNICKNEKHHCGIGKKMKEGKESRLSELIEKANSKKRGEVDKIVDELKSLGLKKIQKSMGDIYVDSGDDEASISVDPKGKKAIVRIVSSSTVDVTGKSIVKLLKAKGFIVK